ncbi:unnamed protein product, partial [Brenthis ino]
MSSDSDDNIFGNVKQTLIGFQKFEFKPDDIVDLCDDTKYEISTKAAGFMDDCIILSDNEANQNITKNKSKRKTRTNKSVIQNTDDELVTSKKTKNESGDKGKPSKRTRKSKEKDDNHILDVVSSTKPRKALRKSPTDQQRRGATRTSPRLRNATRRGYQSHSYTTISIGNTYEYPDELETVPIFNTQPCDIINLDDSDIVDENKELSVKVEWQSVEIIKFTLRKFQKLTKIYDYFCDNHNVKKENLIFIYKDKILQPDDTPDTIGYSEAKLIEGGIVYENVLKLSKNECTNNIVSGIIIKFRTQNSKQPFILSVKDDEKLHLAMIKCAEHLELSLNQLRFEFDGDIVTGKQTAKDLELEGGEYIDVKVIK